MHYNTRRMNPQTTAVGAFFDVDGTLTSDNVWKGIISYFSRRSERRLTHCLFLTAHAPLYLLRVLGLIGETRFRRQWSRHLPWYFKGYDDSQMSVLADWVARVHVAAAERPEVLSILRDHLARGHQVALVSGAPTPIVSAIAGLWGVPHAIGSPAEKIAGCYTGRMSGEPCLDAYKAVYLKQYLKENGLGVDPHASFAYADSYSDLGLFEMVGHPVAVYPDPKLAALARDKGWRVVGK
jgi:HAD superfamily hydrolase (TIGR01490 family)